MKTWNEVSWGLSLVAVLLLGLSGCETLGIGGDDDGVEELDDDEKLERDADRARADWPEHTGPASRVVDLSKYDTITLVPFTNLTDDSLDQEAGDQFVEEVYDKLEAQYPDAFETIRIESAGMGESNEVVLEGQVYDFTKGGHAPYVGRITPRFYAEFVLKDGESGEVLKSSELKEKGEPDNVAMMRQAAEDLVRTLGRGKR